MGLFGRIGNIFSTQKNRPASGIKPGLGIERSSVGKFRISDRSLGNRLPPYDFRIIDQGGTSHNLKSVSMDEALAAMPSGSKIAIVDPDQLAVAPMVTGPKTDVAKAPYLMDQNPLFDRPVRMVTEDAHLPGADPRRDDLSFSQIRPMTYYDYAKSDINPWSNMESTSRRVSVPLFTITRKEFGYRFSSLSDREQMSRPSDWGTLPGKKDGLFRISDRSLGLSKPEKARLGLGDRAEWLNLGSWYRRNWLSHPIMALLSLFSRNKK